MDNNSLNDLIDHWRGIDLNTKPYIHPLDKKCLQNKTYFFKSYCDLLSNSDKYKFHVDLIPVPYKGNIKDATVYILMLNPGFMPSDYFAEKNSPEYLVDVKKNLRQDFEGNDFPFFSLNPKHLWTYSATYWQNKFKDYIGDNALKDIKTLSKKVAILELFPYHSQSFKNTDRLLESKSSSLMREFVKNYVIPKAKQNKACIICTRSVNEWGIIQNENGAKEEDLPNLICYSGGQTRSASLSENVGGGKVFALIRTFLGKN